VSQLVAAAAAQGDTSLVDNASASAAIGKGTILSKDDSGASAAVSRVTSTLAAITQASSSSSEDAVEGLVVLLVEPKASFEENSSGNDKSSNNSNQGLAADVLSFRALALRVAGLGLDETAVRDSLGLPSLPTVVAAAAAKDFGGATVVLSRVPSTSLASLIEVSHDPSAAEGQGWALSGGGIPVGLPAAVEAAQRAVLVAVRVKLSGSSPAVAAAASVSDLSSPGFLGGGDEVEVDAGEQHEKHVFYASAELGSLRGLGWLKQACRPSVVAFGQSAAFNAVMQTPSVRQLLLFDTFVDPDDEVGALDEEKDNALKRRNYF